MAKSRPAAAAAAAGAVVPSAAVSAPDGEPVEQRGASLVTILVGTTAGVLFAAGIALLFLRSRREPAVPANCGRCGAAMPESGSLCVACRREAAEEVRRASAERANQERAQDDFARREREEVELREQQARLEEEERLRQRELARQRDEEDERLRQEQEEEARRQAAALTPSAVPAVQVEETGPWAVLGVSKGAGPDEIYAAYQEAKAKYDPDFVSHLGSDAQEHFKNKAQAIDVAYQQLMAALTSVA
jgi:hypothetical protein